MLRTWCALAVLAILLAGCADDATAPSLVWEAASPASPQDAVQYALACPAGFSGEAPQCPTPLGQPVDQRRLTDIVVDPNDPLHVVAALPVNLGRTTASTDDPDAAPDHVRFLHSLDGGDTWSTGAPIELPWVPSNEGTYDIDVFLWFSSSGRLHAVVRATDSALGFFGIYDFHHYWSDSPAGPWQAGTVMENVQSNQPLFRVASLPDDNLLVMANAGGHMHRAWLSSDDGATWQAPMDLPIKSCAPSQAAVHNGSAWFACGYRGEQDQAVLTMVQVALKPLPGATQLNATVTVHPPHKVDCDVDLWAPYRVVTPHARVLFTEDRGVLIADACTSLARISWSLEAQRWLDPVQVASGHEAFARYWDTLALDLDALGNLHAVVLWYESVQIQTGVIYSSSSRPAVVYLVASPTGALLHEVRLDPVGGPTDATAPLYVDPDAPDRAALAFAADRGWLGWSSLNGHSLVEVQYILPESEAEASP